MAHHVSLIAFKSCVYDTNDLSFGFDGFPTNVYSKHCTIGWQLEDLMRSCGAVGGPFRDSQTFMNWGWRNRRGGNLSSGLLLETRLSQSDTT